MGAEFDALLANHTWTLCPRPLHKNVIRNKWVYKLKQHSDGSIERYKARLVAKGFDQRDGIDYFETFSLVIKPTTLRLVLAVAVSRAWPVRQLDISNAFLHGVLDEEVFMEQPQGFIDKTKPDHVCRLQKAVYGLKQAPRAWFTRLSHALISLGFTESVVDHSLFIFHRDAALIYFLVYVDDILITGPDEHLILQLIDHLKTEFALKDLGSLAFFLGIHVVRDQTKLHLHQSKYITDLLTRTRMIGAKPATTPLSSSLKLSKTEGDPLPDATEYRHVVGALQYCTLTRPDIAYPVNLLCQFMHSPTTLHWSVAKRVLRYLKGTVDHGLIFTKGNQHLQAFCDSD